MIIGLTGSNCSGKDTVAEYLVNNKGFIHYSLSDILREELALRKLTYTRENLIKTGIELRKKYGNSILAKKVLNKLEKNKNYIITSIRHSAEIEQLRKTKVFHLIFVDAPPQIRLKRMLNRNRPGDPKSLEQLLQFEERESNSKGPGQQLKKCQQMADNTIMNDGDTLELLHEKVDALLEELQI